MYAIGDVGSLRARLRQADPAVRASLAGRVDEVHGVDAVATAALGEVDDVFRNRQATEVRVLADLVRLRVGRRLGLAAVVTAVRVGQRERVESPVPAEVGDHAGGGTGDRIGRIYHPGRVRVRHVNGRDRCAVAHERDVLAVRRQVQREFGLRREARHDVTRRHRDPIEHLPPRRQLLEEYRGGHAEAGVDLVVVEDVRVGAVGNRGRTAAAGAARWKLVTPAVMSAGT